MQNNKAFSLIELSIVLIIIGLLVVGVTGGKSLIDSARVVSFMGEVKGYQQAVFIFAAQSGRYPGDIDDIGKFGDGSGYEYTEFSFPAPFNVKAPNTHSAPFIDLYLAGITNFKPTINGVTSAAGNSGANTTGSSKGIPTPKLFTKGVYYFYQSKNLRIYIPSASNMIPTNFAKNVDLKMDDGNSATGKMKAQCQMESGSWSGTYETGIKGCWEFQFPF